MEKNLNRLAIVEIAFGELLNAYAEIDAFSQAKTNSTKKFTSRNMGKNDLWIAAITKLTDSTLLTSDKDFNHLDGDFFRVEVIENLDLKQ